MSSVELHFTAPAIASIPNLRDIRGYVTRDGARARFGDMLRQLAESVNLPALFHRTTGKDRTGWAATALLTLLGVSDDAVIADYLLSNDYILPEYGAMIDQYTAGDVDKDILLSILACAASTWKHRSGR